MEKKIFPGLMGGKVKESYYRISVQPNVESKSASKRSSVKDLWGSIGKNIHHYVFTVYDQKSLFYCDLRESFLSTGTMWCCHVSTVD